MPPASIAAQVMKTSETDLAAAAPKGRWLFTMMLSRGLDWVSVKHTAGDILPLNAIMLGMGMHKSCSPGTSEHRHDGIGCSRGNGAIGPLAAGGGAAARG